MIDLTVKVFSNRKLGKHVLRSLFFFFSVMLFSGCTSYLTPTKTMEDSMPAFSLENSQISNSGPENKLVNKSKPENKNKLVNKSSLENKNTPKKEGKQDIKNKVAVLEKNQPAMGFPFKRDLQVKKTISSKNSTSNKAKNVNPFLGLIKAAGQNTKKNDLSTSIEKNEKLGVTEINEPTASATATATASSDSVSVELAFDNADLFEVLDATLFELYKVNYIIDPHVKAKVSFHFSGDYTESEFINLFNNVLQLNNLSITHGPGNMYRIVRKSENSGFLTSNVSKKTAPDTVGDISRFIKLRYVACTAVAKNINTFASKGVRVVLDRVNNAVIVTDTKENMAKIINLISMMDVPYFKDVSWRIFPVTEVDANDIARDILKIVKSSGLYNRPGALAGGYQVIPIKSMNAILVVTRWPSMIDLVETWISAMDHSDDSGTGVFVYFVENGTAEELSDILKQLYGGKKSSSQKRQIVAPVQKSKKTPASSVVNVTGELSGDVEIIPDTTNNAIVFKATKRDYKIIRKVLKELDVVPRQVLINVVIAEVTLNKKSEYGVQWLINNKMGDYTGKGGQDITESARVVDQLLGTTNGLSYGVFNSVDILKGLVTALGADSDINILSSPNIMAVDNKEAFIEVGEDIPTITGSLTATDGAVTNTVQYKKTGIILKVTPHINSNGLVKMELSQEVSERGTLDKTANSYSILNRKAETSLVVQDGQTILMAGLMRGKNSASDSGIPFLKDIPILGYFFKGVTKETNKVELMFLLTPRVVNSRVEADKVTEEFSNKIENIKELIENSIF